MRKGIATVLLFIISIAACLGLASCNKEDDAVEYLPLFDERGVYLEENYVYNAALEKDGAHLVVNGATEYKILYEETSDESVHAAIGELKKYFDTVCGGIAVEAYHGEEPECAIMIGKFLPLATTVLEKPGAYIVDVGEKTVYIYAETVYGLTNGIYGFMEDYLGCMFFDRDTTYIPPVRTVILSKKADVQEPAFESRNVGDTEVNGNVLFAQKMRVRQDETFSSNGCHNSLNRIAKDILAQHPEYYAEYNGVRKTTDYLAQGTQLCFSNEEVIDLLEEAIVNAERNKTSDQTVWWDISQQDSMNYCRCEKCMAQTRAAGGNPAAPIFNCVNTIAKRHPELKLSTLAYHYGSTPPKNITFEDNVMIKWCIMSTDGQNDYSLPISEKVGAIATKQYNEIIGWSELVDHIYVWDYITDFFYYQLPFPCFDAMSGNIKLLRDCKVDGVLTLASHNHRGAFDRLKVNYAAHLLWNPDFDAWQFIGKFVTLYFGKEAAPYLLETYHLMQESVTPPLWVYSFPDLHEDDYLSSENVERYFELHNAAVSASAGNETYLKRLRYEKISLLFTAIYLYYEIEEDMDAMKREFVALCDEFSITSLNEISSETVNRYRE